MSVGSRHVRRGHIAGNATVALALALSAWRVIGIPDADAVRRFWSGGRPGSTAAFATAGAMVWAVVLGVGVWLVAGAARELTDVAARHRAQLSRGVAVLTVGCLMLGVGLIRHHTGTVQICCGDAASAGANLGR